MSATPITEVEYPETGRVYLVPTVYFKWFHLERLWPVLLPGHSDGDFLGFPHPHHHVDGRFVPDLVRRSIVRRGPPGRTFKDICSGWPLARRTREPSTENPVFWRPRRCMKSSVGHTRFQEAGLLWSMYRHFSGHQCRRRNGAWVCPHRGYELREKPDEDGYLTCPMHGLRVHAETGIVETDVREEPSP